MTDKPRGRARITADGQVQNMSMYDGYGNLVAGIGMGLDKPSRGGYYAHTFGDQELVAAYETSFLPKRIVDTIAEDATRRWRMWNAKKSIIDAIEAEENRVDILNALERTMKHARLLGGAAIYFPIRGQAPATELEIGSVGKGDLRKVICFDQLTLVEGDLDDDLDSENFGNPKFYTFKKPNGTDVQIHHSRVIRLTGDNHVLGTPRFGHHWGRSVLQTILGATKHVDGSIAATATLILEARIDVISIQGLMQKMQQDPDYERTLIKRFSMASMGKSVNGTLILDELEKYHQKSQTYGSLPELLDRFFQYVSGSCGIPVTRLFGTSPGGMNATGEADIRHYYDRVQTMQNNVLKPALEKFDQVMMRSALGTIPRNTFYTWRSLWQVTEKERAEIGKNIVDMGAVMSEKGLIDSYSAGAAVVNALVENECMPGIEAAWELHQTVRNAPVEPVDQMKLATAQLEAKKQQSADPANNNAPPRSSSEPVPVKKVATKDERGPMSLYVRRDVLNSKEILTWAKSQGIKELFPAEELHVTIIYSETPVDWMEMDGNWPLGAGGLVVEPGGARMLDVFGKTLVLRFNNSSLKWRNLEMREKGASSNFEKYAPHVSLSVNLDGVNLDDIVPYVGKIELGPEIFEEIKQ